MKKKKITKIISILIIGVICCTSIIGCGSKEINGQNTMDISGADDILNTIIKEYDEDSKFPIAGGDSAHQVMDKPGNFDLELKDELDAVTGFPAREIENISEAATMIHMLNANIFTGAAYKLKDVDREILTESIRNNFSNRQWICGAPETLLIMSVNDYLIVAFGEDKLINSFESNAKKALNGIEVIANEPIEG